MKSISRVNIRENKVLPAKILDTTLVKVNLNIEISTATQEFKQKDAKKTKLEGKATAKTKKYENKNQ